MNKAHQSLLVITTFFKIDVRRLFRDKVALFFTFLFPLIFLLVFGSLFGNNTNLRFNVAVINDSKSEFATQLIESMSSGKIFNINQDVTVIDRAKDKLSRGELDAVIVLPENFGQTVTGQRYPTGEARILYDQSNEQGGQALAAVIQDIFGPINNQLSPRTEAFTVQAESTAIQGSTNFDYVFAGLLGFAILSLGIFGPTSVFPKLKHRGVLRRYKTTPLQIWQYFTGNVLSNSLYGVMSVTLMFIVAVLLFDLTMRGSYALLLALVVFGTIVLFGIGLAVGGWAKNENQAAPLANLIAFPMMFLSGSFFPRFLMPDWLQQISDYLPLTPLIDGARLIITEGRTFIELLPQFGLLAIWFVIIYVIAFRVFRWE